MTDNGKPKDDVYPQPRSHIVDFAFDDRWMSYARLGFSKGSAPIYNESVTVGFIRKFLYRDRFDLAFVLRIIAPRPAFSIAAIDDEVRHFLRVRMSVLQGPTLPLRKSQERERGVWPGCVHD